MYRACSTWQYEVAAHLVEQARGGRRLGYVPGDAYDPPGRAGSPGWRVLKSHEGHPAFRAALRAGRAVALYSYRDARDVVYSMLHKRRVDFETFLARGMIHQILANDRDWTRRAAGPRLVQQYERIVADPEGAVAEIAAFLGLAVAPADAARLAAEYSFEANRRRAEATARRLRAAGVDLDDAANAIVYDDRSLLHWNHLRQGRVGDWRDRATPAERYVLARLLNGWLAAHGYAPEAVEASAEALGRDERARLDRLMHRGRLACALRCAAQDFPRTGRLVKRVLGLRPRDVARPAPAVPRPHCAGGPAPTGEPAERRRAGPAA